jgi:hypothetical protein
MPRYLCLGSRSLRPLLRSISELGYRAIQELSLERLAFAGAKDTGEELLSFRGCGCRDTHRGVTEPWGCPHSMHGLGSYLLVIRVDGGGKIGI